mgnify:CR=1 FL=1
MEKEIELSNGTVVKMRKPKVKDLRLVSSIKDPIDQELAMVGNLSGLTAEELDELDLEDYKKLQKELGVSD